MNCLISEESWAVDMTAVTVACGKISVVVPVFNAGSYIDGCLNSIISQIAFLHEVILVDDCSTDERTIAALHSYEETAKFKIIFNEVNIGVCESQNVGVNKATGEYIAFVDCDDMLLPGALQAIIEAIDEGGYDYIFTNRVHIDNKNQIVGCFRAEEKIRDLQTIHDGLLDSMFASHFKVLKRISLMQVGGFVQGTEGIQDWDVALKISEFGRFCFIPEFLYAHRIHENQTTARQQSALFLKTNEVRRQALERQKLIFEETISTASLSKVKNVMKHLRFARSHHGVKFTEKIKVGIALAWMENRLCVYHLDAFLHSKIDNDFEWIIIYGMKWHELGMLRKNNSFVMTPIIYAVDERSQDSVAMARWFSSYFYGVAYMSEAAELAVSGYIDQRIVKM